MTTNIRVSRTEDLFTENNVMNLTQTRPSTALAGASWVADEAPPIKRFWQC